MTKQITHTHTQSSNENPLGSEQRTSRKRHKNQKQQQTFTMVEHKNEDSLHAPLIATAEGSEAVVADDEKTKVVAAGVGGAIVGLFIMGPVGAALLGFTCAYAAEHKDGVVGDTARSMGDLAITARQKVVTLDSQYKATETACKTTETVWNTAKAVDPVGVLDKSKEVAVKTYQTATTYVTEKRLLQRGTEEVGRRVCWFVEKIVGGRDKAIKTSMNDAMNDASPTSPSVY
jgi:hypothetical protein